MLPKYTGCIYINRKHKKKGEKKKQISRKKIVNQVKLKEPIYDFNAVIFYYSVYYTF